MCVAKRGTISVTIALSVLSVVLSRAFAQVETPQTGKESSASPLPAATKEGTQEDPFKDLAPAATPQEAPKEPERSWVQMFLTENFGFRKEIMSQFDINKNGRAASRQSVGFEVLKKFSTPTSTVGSFNFQGDRKSVV